MFFHLIHEGFEFFRIRATDIDRLVVFEFELQAGAPWPCHDTVEAGELGIPFLEHGFLWSIDNGAFEYIIPHDLAFHSPDGHHAELDAFLGVFGDYLNGVEVIEYAREYEDGQGHDSQYGAADVSAHHELDEGYDTGDDESADDGQEIPLAEALFVFIFYLCHSECNIVKCLQEIYIEFT